MNPTDKTLLSNASPSSPSATLATTAVGTPDAAAATNDNVLPRRLRVDPRNLVSHPDVVRAIEGTLRAQYVPRRELPDSVAEVQVRMLHAVRDKPAPETVPEWKALGRTIAERMIITAKQRAKKRRRWNEGPCDKPDDAMPIQRSPGRRRDPVDMGRQIEAIRGLYEAGKMPKDGDLILFRAADGFTAPEIAEELKVSVGTVEKRLFRIRKLAKAKLGSLGLLMTMLMLMVFLAIPLGGGVGAPAPAKDAPALRHDALDACDAGEWRECLDDLDEARALDPDGDDAPVIRQARERAQRALASEKPAGDTSSRP